MNSKTKILLIEDNPGDTRLVREYLFEGDVALYDFNHAESLQSGLTLLNNKKVDVILLDLSLPDSSGIDTYRNLQEKAGGVPTIILTGNDDDELARQAVHLGAQDYLVKNRIDGTILNRVITYAIERNYLNAEFKKVNRTLKVLSKVNRTVIRSDNEFQLIKQICDATVNLGNYPLVWVGYLNRDNGKITNVGHSGTRTDFDDIIKIACNNSNMVECPICQTIEKNSVLVIQDIQDSDLGQLKQKTEKLGLKSLIIFPLKINRELNAAISIYSDEIDGFNPNEIDLLTELAGDLAYGIRSIRTNQEKIQAQKALIENERKFRLLAENSIDVVWQMDSRLRFTYASPSIYEMSGFTPEEWIGTRLSQHATWKEYFQMARKAIKAFKNYKTFKHITFEARMLRKDGTEFPVEISSKLIFNNNGFPIGLQGTTRDITDRKIAEEKIKLNQERLESLLRINQFESENTQELLDYALEEALKLTESKIGYIYHYSEKDQQFTLNTWSAGVMTACSIKNPPTVYHLEKTGVWGETVRQRKPIILNDFQAPHPLKKGTPEGHAKLYNFMTIPVIQDKQVIAVIGVANKPIDYDDDDVMQLTLLMDSVWKMVIRKASEKALQDSEKRYRSYIDNAPDGIFIANQNGEYLEVNHAACKTTGYTEAELLTQSITDQIPPDFREEATELLKNLVAEGSTTIEIPFLKKNGSQGYWIVEIVKLSDNRFLGLTKDITAQKLAEDKQENLQKQLSQSQKMEAVGQLAGGVAHDFNNLLTIISGNADLMLMNCPKEDNFISNLEQIKKASERAAALTRQLLAFSRKQIIQPKITDLNILVSNMKKMLQRLIGEDMNLVTRLSDNLPTMKADEGQIEQTLMNLVVNARDAMPDGGKIHVQTDLRFVEKPDSRFMPDAEPGEYLHLSVTDTGTGIAPNYMEHIFEPFFTTKESGKGTGLGLAVIYGIIKQHNGWIDVESEPGAGSTFHVYLPVCKEATEAITPEKSQTRTTANRSAKILILEDDTAVRELTKAMLANHGFTIIDSGSCTEAHKIFLKEHESIDLVISDVVLPDGSGLNFINTLSNIKPDVKILMTSGYLDDKSQFKDITDKGYHFIQKPYIYDNFIQLVSRLVET